MEGFRIARVILTIVPAAIDLISHGRRGLGLYETLDVWWRARKDRMSRLSRRYGPILTTMANMIPEVLDIVGGIDKVLTGTDDDAKEFKQSLSSNLNMIAVAVGINYDFSVLALSLRFCRVQSLPR
jgi:hypothetical protein